MRINTLTSPAAAAGSPFAAARVSFTREMKRTHTILIPGMLPIHFALARNVFLEYGYKVELLTNNGSQIPRIGLQYVHNDTCYPALLTIGQMLDAVLSGRHHPDRTALVMTQTGGGCRASNYIHLLRKALQRAGLPQVPVISLNLKGLEDNPGFQITLPMVRKVAAAVLYGDLLMLLSNQVRPYEVRRGETDALLQDWIERIGTLFRQGKGMQMRQMRKNLGAIAGEFERIRVVPRDTIKVGIVGEIYMQYSSLGNNDLEAFLQEQGCEVMLPGVLSFAAYCVSNAMDDDRLYGVNLYSKTASRLLTGYLAKLEGMVHAAVKGTRFVAPGSFWHKRELAQQVVSLGCKMGEGWLLPAEMLEFIEMGYRNIVCVQPFGCLPNHICGRGAVNRIKELYKSANIVPIDYDAGASRVNQENRIKLMLATARGI